MLDFRRLFEFLFKSFRISRDTDQIARLVQEGCRFVMLIKRSYIYGIYAHLLYVPLIGLSVLNAYLATRAFNGSWDGYAVVATLLFNMAFSLYYSIRYTVYFRRTYRGGHDVRDIETVHERLIEGDARFTEFFNQALANLALFLVAIAYYVIHVVFVSQFAQGIFAVVDIVGIVAQFFLLRYFTSLLTNLEMDYTLVVPGRIHFANQKGFYAEIQSIDADKIKTVRALFPNFLASFFNYGNISILTEGDETMGFVTLVYVDRPEDTVENMNQLLENRLDIIEAIHNVYLRRIIEKHKFDADGADFREKIRQFLAEYESQIRADYANSQDQETKDEIREIYRQYGYAKNADSEA